MLSKLNYFNKLICMLLMMLVICFSNSTYINVLLIVLPFSYFIFNNNYKLSILSGISFIIYSSISSYYFMLWPFKIWQVFIYILLLRTIFTEREKNVFINRMFYSFSSTKNMIKKLCYRIKNKEYKSNLFGLSYSLYLRKQNKKKVVEEIKDLSVIAKLKYYGINKKRKEYGITVWNKVDSTVLCILILITVISVLY